MKKSDSFPGCCDSLIAGMMAPNKLPKWGLPLLCIPVNILAIVLQRKEKYLTPSKRVDDDGVARPLSVRRRANKVVLS